MNLVRWNPWGELSSVQNEMNRLFGDFFSRGAAGAEAPSTWLPALNVSEDDGAVHISAELPGLNRDEIEIEFHDGILSLRGEKKFEKEDKDKTYHRIERSYGSFVRQIALPANVKADEAKAEFTNGVLSITVPKSEEAKPKKIEIK